MKTCKKCDFPKPEDDFYFVSGSTTKRRATCIACSKQYHEQNRDVILTKRRKHWEDNKDTLNEKRRTDEHRSKNRVQQKKRRAKVNEQERAKRKSDPVFRLRKYLSKNIARALSNNGSHKSMSFLKCVPYTMEDLRNHLENQFESWMTWDNQGSYYVDTWNDNDKSTWTWQLDHIIPHSLLPYTSMEEDNFKKCWALSNLRPLSSKQNLLDGANKSRHVI